MGGRYKVVVVVVRTCVLFMTVLISSQVLLIVVVSALIFLVYHVRLVKKIIFGVPILIRIIAKHVNLVAEQLAHSQLVFIGIMYLEEVLHVKVSVPLYPPLLQKILDSSIVPLGQHLTGLSEFSKLVYQVVLKVLDKILLLEFIFG